MKVGRGPNGKKGFHGSVKQIIMRIVGGGYDQSALNVVKLSKN